MATKVTMEALSPTMEEGRLVTWSRKEGDAVKTGDVLAEVETDKAIMELVARADGVLLKLLVPEGTAAPVGTLLGVIGAAGEDISVVLSAAKDLLAAPTTAVPAPTAKPDVVLSAAKDPLVPPAAAPVAPGDKQALRSAQGDTGGFNRASPLARRLAGDAGLDIRTIAGSGPGGRIIKRDIEAAMSGVVLSEAKDPLVSSVEKQALRSAPGDNYRDIPLTQIRKTIAKRLAESIGPIPTFYLTAGYDLSKVMELRRAMAELGDDFKVSVNDVILKAVATALAQHPEVNSHWLGDRIRQHDRVHLGMAVATDDGLIVPVIFDAHLKRMKDLSREAKELAKKARERKLKPEEYTGSTFSVSNLGMFGIDQFTAIINPPECSILAIGTASEQVIIQDGAVGTCTVLRVTMSCDHRAIDGAVGAKFMQTLRRMIENPLMLVY